MADPKQPSTNPGGNAFVWVAIVAAAVAYVGSHANLETLRPPGNDPSPNNPNAIQDVNARLWQDPFEAVLQADGTRYGWITAKGPASGSTLPPCGSQPDAHCTSPLTGADSATPVIGIIVPGDSYSETVEFRRRTRYAVLAAFHVLGYSPRDAQHIGVYIPPQAQGQSAAPYAGGPQFVPYEFLDSERSGHSRILFWLDEETLGNRPLDRLARFFCNLDSAAVRESGVRILGPQGSDTLLGMAHYAGDWKAAWATCNAGSDSSHHAPGPAGAAQAAVSSAWKPPGLTLYDYSATADPLALCRQAARGNRVARSECLGGDWVASQFGDASIGFMRATTTDNVLAQAIRAELADRNIRPGNDSGHVLLISELDTLYGRSLPAAVERCLESRSLDGPCDETGSDDAVNEHARGWLIRYSYLRGLDGQAAAPPKVGNTADAATNAGTPTGAKSDTATASSPPNPAALLSETAEGEGQGDYLMRMAAALREQDARLRNGGGRGIVAVGVLGSDVYDKLLVYESAKAALPHALFFTTDLDERLVRPARDVSTVNLIVASGLGSSLRRGLQQDIPPFRGSYQTAAFLGTLMAACRDCAAPGSTPGEASEALAASAWFTQAETYEIGRTRPILLHAADSPRPSDCDDGTGPPDVFECTSVLPAYRLRRSSGLQALGLFLLEACTAWVLSALLLRVGIGPRPCVESDQTPSQRGRLINILRWSIPTLSATLVLAFQLWDRGLLEHADLAVLFQGVSLWPSICIQMFSVVFGIAVVFNVGRSSEENLLRVRELLGMGTFLRDLEQHRSIGEFHWRRAFPLCVRKWKRIDALAAEDPRDLKQASDERTRRFWFRYIDYARHRAQFRRVTMLTLLGLTLAWAVHLVFPSPLQPVSSSTGILSTSVALLNAITTLAVAVYIGDITLFSRLFVREAFARDSYPPLWSTQARESFANQLLGKSADTKPESENGKPSDSKIAPKDGEPSPPEPSPTKSELETSLVTTTMTLVYVSERTKSITHFIYYPFIMIALSVMSLSPVLGPAGFGPWSISIQAMSLLVAFLSAAFLRSAAEDARSETVRSLKILKWQSLMPGSQPGFGGRLDLLLEYVSELKEGAFSPLSQQPFVRALIVPLATYGSTLLVGLLSIAS